MHHIVTDKFKLPPLEYCSLDRASRLLMCEVEDLFHWHEIGAIQLCIRFDGSEEFEHKINGWSLHRFYSAGVIPNSISYDLSNYSRMRVTDSENAIAPTLKELDDIPSLLRFSHYYNVNIRLSGFWKLIPKQFTSSGGNTDVCVYSNEITDEFKYSLAMPEEFESNVIYIMKNDVDRLIKSNGEPLPNYINGKIQHQKEAETPEELDKTHKNQEINALKREAVLLAAMYVMERHPEECSRKNGKKSLAAIAKAICNHSYTLFNSEEPPISNIRVLSEIIGDAYKLPNKRKRAGKVV